MGLIVNIIFILCLFNFFEKGDVAVDFHLKKANHEPKSLDSSDIAEVAKMSDMDRFERILSNILVPRVVGSETHRKVREYIMNEMKGLGYSVETEVSQQNTPIGQLTFTNIIGRLNPSADRYLVLACHYDSKRMREGEFLGATDSAVPCAMMLDLAFALKDKVSEYNNTELSLMLLFFDGEEAFDRWGPTDSIYGARSLAKTWEKTNYPLKSSSTNHLHRMDLLVLLDLIGTPRPTFYNYFKNTQKWFLRFASAEKRLTDLNLLKKRHNEVYFYKINLNAHIEDDHIPFIRKDVPCVHLIPTPFPDVWHTPEDNHSALDMDTINNLNKILRVFTLEYLEGDSRLPRDVEAQATDL